MPLSVKSTENKIINLIEQNLTDKIDSLGKILTTSQKAITDIFLIEHKHLENRIDELRERFDEYVINQNTEKENYKRRYEQNRHDRMASRILLFIAFTGWVLTSGIAYVSHQDNTILLQNLHNHQISIESTRPSQSALSKNGKYLHTPQHKNF